MAKLQSLRLLEKQTQTQTQFIYSQTKPLFHVLNLARGGRFSGLGVDAQDAVLCNLSLQHAALVRLSPDHDIGPPPMRVEWCVCAVFEYRIVTLGRMTLQIHTGPMILHIYMGVWYSLHIHTRRIYDIFFYAHTWGVWCSFLYIHIGRIILYIRMGCMILHKTHTWRVWHFTHTHGVYEFTNMGRMIWHIHMVVWFYT